ncbi:hypothetical protein JKP88DRAFT_326715 [Tribonema minus]|uniref:RRM domain-containing protein n=1 Tax=Tribonema minus TaxID=303371 RepID=A0A835YQ88_9STRA|nr:hypothetical protein JKP88DRAFT_326715 [Tribonema minus]
MARVYVGNLPMNVREKDVEDLFYKFGRIRDIDLKTPARPPAFAFVAFDDVRDAEDAVRARDGYEMDGERLRVELARGARGPPGMGGRGGFGGQPMGGGRQTEWRVIVTGLPPSASWQDLKDHMRKAGDVVYTDVDHRGGGIVHYNTRDDMEYALRKLDDSEFRNPFDHSFIRVLPHRGASGGRGGGGGGRRDSRSRSPPRRRRASYSSSRSRSRSRSPPRRRRSRSASSRSRSRSPSPAAARSNGDGGGAERMEEDSGAAAAGAAEAADAAGGAGADMAAVEDE